ncbi:MAG: GFA family protein [Inquilinaceae bacterium]
MSHLSGHCLCGAISFHFDGDIARTVNCHCVDCRHATGAAFGTAVFVPADGLRISGEPRAFTHLSDSGSTMTKLFCATCGSQMFGRNSRREGIVGIRAGVIDQVDAVKPAMNVFGVSAIPSTPMDPSLPVFERMPG